MPNIRTQPVTPGDVLLYEAGMDYSRKTVTIPDGQAVEIGTVVKADGGPLAAAADGALARGVVIYPLNGVAADATGADRRAVIIHTHAIVKSQFLNFGSGTEADARAALEAAGVQIRTTQPSQGDD